MANWYAYLGFGDPTLPTSYRLMNFKPTCTGVGGQICAIYLNDTNAIPSAFNGVSIYISNALGTLTAQPSGVGQKRFVYVRCVCPLIRVLNSELLLCYKRLYKNHFL
jgi:hypothetical protein